MRYCNSSPGFNLKLAFNVVKQGNICKRPTSYTCPGDKGGTITINLPLPCSPGSSGAIYNGSCTTIFIGVFAGTLWLKAPFDLSLSVEEPTSSPTWPNSICPQVASPLQSTR